MPTNHPTRQRLPCRASFGSRCWERVMKIDTRWLPAIFIWLAIASPARAEPPDALCPTGPLGATQDATLEREWESQFAALRNDLNNRERLTRTAAETFRSEALIHESDRDPADVVLRRTAALLKDLQRSSGGSPELSRLERELAELQSSGASIDVGLADARYALFANACRLRRLIALQNPLLDFDEILFIKRHRALYSHMCDQYYGMAATPGGGLYILADAFGPAPQPRDVLAEAVVERGRLAGQRLSGGPTTPPEWRFDGMGNLHGDDSAERQGRQPNQSDRSGADNPLPLVAEIVPQNTPISETTGLCLKTPLPSGERLGEGLNLRATRPSPNPSLIGRGTFATKPSARGSFLSPDLSYDGKTVLFAYVECQGDPRHRHHTDPTRGHWDEGRCYHIFKVNVDGTRAGATDRRHLERLRSLLAAQRPDRLHHRAPRRLPALRPGLSDLHAVRHGRRRQRHQLPELPRDERVASERDQRRPDHLDALGLRRSARLHRPHAVDHDAGRPRPARRARQLRPPAVAARHGARLPCHPRLAQVRGHRRAAPRPGLRLAGADRPARAGRRRHGAGQADHARGRLSREPGRRPGLRHALAVERGLLPVRLRRGDAAGRGIARASRSSRATTASTWSTRSATRS